MQRVKRSTAAVALPAPPAGGTAGFFAAPNPQGGPVATVPGYEWYNNVQEELLAVVEGAGLVASDTDRTQLRQAIQAMVTGAQKAVVVNAATFEASVATGEVVRWDSTNNRFDEAIADGTANNRAVGIADITNGKVYIYGECPLFSGLTPGARYYLDATTPGALTTIAAVDAVMVGIAKSATVMWVDIDIIPAGAILAFLASAKNLDVQIDFVTPNSKAVIGAGEILVKDAAGNPKLLSNVSVTVDMAVSGVGGLDTGAEAANTWYYLWVIYNQTNQTVAGLVSASETAPTMPSGYTYKALASVVRNDASSNFLAFHQRGDLYQYKAAQTVLSAGTATVLTAINLSSVVPPQVKSALLQVTKNATNSNGNTDGFVYAGNATTSAALTASAYANASIGISDSSNAELLLEWPEYSPNIYYINVQAGNLTVNVNGFRLAGVGTF